jgi:SAM-dependent methyltransferase
MLENITSCLFCKSNNIKKSSYEDTFYNNKTFQYLTCKDCNLVFVNPLPNETDYIAMYPVEYQGSFKTKADGLYDTLFPHIKKHASGVKLLDYGCGNGRFIVEAIAQGYEVTATEFAPDLVKGLKEHFPKATFYTIDDFWDTSEQYDVIFISNVLEHLSNPYEIMEKLTPRLSQNGIFVIEGPIEDNFNIAQKFRKTIFGIRKTLLNKKASHAPRHIFYANAKNQQEFIEQFGVTTCHYEIKESSWPFPSNLKDCKGMKDKLFYYIAKFSLRLSKSRAKWGNNFIYIGKKVS